MQLLREYSCSFLSSILNLIPRHKDKQSKRNRYIHAQKAMPVSSTPLLLINRIHDNFTHMEYCFAWGLFWFFFFPVLLVVVLGGECLGVFLIWLCYFYCREISLLHQNLQDQNTILM